MNKLAYSSQSKLCPNFSKVAKHYTIKMHKHVSPHFTTYHNVVSDNTFMTKLKKSTDKTFIRDSSAIYKVFCQSDSYEMPKLKTEEQYNLNFKHHYQNYHTASAKSILRLNHHNLLDKKNLSLNSSQMHNLPGSAKGNVQGHMGYDPFLNSRTPKRYFYAPISRLVTDVGMDTYRGRKRQNEDEYTVFETRIEGRRWLAACVFDGHGGKAASLFCKTNVQQTLESYLDRYNKLRKKEKRMGAYRGGPLGYTIENALQDTIKELDDRYVTEAKANPTSYSAEIGLEGCTATICLVGRNELFLAYVGDSPAVMYHTNGSMDNLQLVQHKPNEATERQRIEAAGGYVMKLNGVARLQGMCAVSRAIGDFSLKNKGMIAEPTITRLDIDNSFGCLVIASDGLFDGIDPEILYKLLMGSSNTMEAAKRANFEAELGGSRDNVTSIIVPLDGWLAMRTPINKAPLFEHMRLQYAARVGHTDTQLEKQRLKTLFLKLMALIEVYMPREYTSHDVIKSIQQFSETGQGPFGEAAFKAFDTRCNGKLDAEECMAGMKKLGTMYSKEELDESFALADHDGSKHLNLAEFRKYLRTVLQVHKLDQIECTT